MSKTVKDMLVRDYTDRLGDTSEALVISIRGIPAEGTTAIRSQLRDKDIHVQVVRNALVRRALAGTGLEPVGELLKGACALAYGSESVVEVAREVVELVKTFPDLELKGAILDGTLFEGEDGVKQLSKFPTRDEAIAQDVTLVLSPGRNLVASVLGPGSTVASLVKAIEDKLEKGEEISPVA